MTGKAHDPGRVKGRNCICRCKQRSWSKLSWIIGSRRHSSAPLKRARGAEPVTVIRNMNGDSILVVTLDSMCT